MMEEWNFQSKLVKRRGREEEEAGKAAEEKKMKKGNAISLENTFWLIKC